MTDPFALEDGADFAPPPPGPSPETLLAGLNPEQAEAVRATEGPVLVLSGAGTGKTRVLTTRLAWLLAGGFAQPWQCLAVTFTNRAAREMRERVAQIIGPDAASVALGTFHSLGARMLRRDGERIGLPRDFTILDADDQLRLVKQVAAGMGLDPKRWPPQALSSVIQRWKDRGVGPDQVGADPGAEYAGGRAVAAYRAYQGELARLSACDFGDLLLKCLDLFREAPDVLARYQRRFRYILVDEYQDTNVAQGLWLKALAMGHRNLCCVGDDDQSIYSWRGAEVGNILRFTHDFPGARVIRLETNYRSTGHILAAASALIARNADRLGKTLRPASGEAGEKVKVQGVWTGEDEARVVVEEAEALQRRGTPLAEIAVLVRAGYQTRAFEERLMSQGVPYRVVGGPRFYERQEIRDAVAYLRLIRQPADDLAFERIVNLPRRGIGDATVEQVRDRARAAGMPMTRAAEDMIAQNALPARARGALSRFLADVGDWRVLAASADARSLLSEILEGSGYLDMWRQDKSPDAPGRIENLKELLAALDEFADLSEFLEYVSLVMENQAGDEIDRLSVMTLHAAKGLEFDQVFLPGWEDGVFPNQRALDETGAKGLEEERRLAHVGLTRARKGVTVTFAAARRIYGQWQNNMPSRFIDDLPDEHIERISESGMGASLPLARSAFAAAPLAERPAVKEGAYARGQRVFHDKFGYGEIRAVDGNKLEVAFDKAGLKKVMAGFVAPAGKDPS
jgi:DNA helicase-2/ATP-dependent DNA helicase PcrA